MIRFVSRQPIGQSPLQPQPARLERVQPDGLERGQQSIRIVLPGPAQDKRHADHGLRLQRTNGGLAVVAEKFDQFVDDFGFVFLAGPGVTRTLQNQHFLSGNLTHFQVHSSVTPFLSQRMVHVNHFPPPTVTFFLSQFAGALFSINACNAKKIRTKCRPKTFSPCWNSKIKFCSSVTGPWRNVPFPSWSSTSRRRTQTLPSWISK